MKPYRSPLAHKVIGAAIKVHRNLGQGLFESVYDAALSHELVQSCLPFERQVAIPVSYGGIEIGPAFRADFVGEGRLLVEIKAVERFHPVHSSQVLTYLRLTGLEQALLINFNVAVLRHGIKSFLSPALLKK